MNFMVVCVCVRARARAFNFVPLFGQFNQGRDN